MSTTIEWTQRPGTKGETWNPVVGCTKVSAGCKHCYAKTIHDNRHKAYREGKLQRTPQYAVPFEHVQLMPDRLMMPLKWKSPRTIFVNSVSDLFHESVPFSYIDQVFAVMALTPQHTYQILTKRPERMSNYLRGDGDHTTGNHYDTRKDIRDSAWARIGQMQIDVATDHDLAITRPGHSIPSEFTLRQQCAWPLPNVWLGTSVEDQATADERIPHLLRCPAAVRFLSCEPLLGAVDLNHVLYDGVCVIDCLNGTHGWPNPHADLPKNTGPIHWVITGGESGSKARPMHPDWARSLRDQCKAAGVPFFFKQWGEWCPATEEYGVTGHVMPESNPKYTWIGGDGTLQAPSAHGLKEPIMAIARQGKHRAGRLLDGVEHSAYPAMNTPQPLPA